MPSIAQTESGVWEFHGKDKPTTITSDLTVVGDAGDAVGCRHDTSIPNTAYMAVLRPGALDEPARSVFDRQILARAALPELQRSLTLETTDDFDSFIFEVFALASRASSGRRSESSSKLRVQRMKRFIEQHAFETIEVSDIAKSVGLSPFACIRQFKVVTGVSPHRYLSSLRLNRARSMLRNTRLSIIEVAAMIGIKDRCYFTRWFAKEAGMPPQRYRLTMQ
jgi:AraC-like DNA-binding protein